METKNRRQLIAAAGAAGVVVGVAALTVILYELSVWWHALVH